MITYVKQQKTRQVTGDDGNAHNVELMEVRGKSTDAKPTQYVENGSSFLEFDTGKLFFFDGEIGDWIYPYGGDGDGS